MIIKEIELRDFRNYESLNLQLHNKVNIFLGDNAQGKTNIVEGIYLSALGKSFRTAKDSEMVNFGKEFCRIKVKAEREEGEKTVEIVITDKNKGIKIDGRKIRKTAELLENIYAVIFSPEDLKIVKEDPEKRRRFINTELCQIKPGYYKSLSDYRRILKQRNALLKEGRVFGREIDISALEIWDSQLSCAGSDIMLKRKDFIEKLRDISRELQERITDGRESLDLIYEPNVEIKDSIEEQTEKFKKTLEENWTSDIKSGTTGRGPHRDDICIMVNGVDIRKFGSQGQQRTAALSLKLAEIRLIKEETGENPVLLLDDVLSELDAGRQNFLINSLEDVQLFITSTEITESVKKALPEGKIFTVKKGVVFE